MKINSVHLEAKGIAGSGKTQIIIMISKFLEQQGLEVQEIREHGILINGELKTEIKENSEQLEINWEKEMERGTKK